MCTCISPLVVAVTEVSILIPHVQLVDFTKRKQIGLCVFGSTGCCGSSVSKAALGIVDSCQQHMYVVGCLNNCNNATEISSQIGFL